MNKNSRATTNEVFISTNLYSKTQLWHTTLQNDSLYFYTMFAMASYNEKSHHKKHPKNSRSFL